MASLPSLTAGPDEAWQACLIAQKAALSILASHVHVFCVLIHVLDNLHATLVCLCTGVRPTPEPAHTSLRGLDCFQSINGLPSTMPNRMAERLRVWPVFVLASMYD